MHDTDQIKRQTNIVSVIGQYTKLTKSGKEHVGLCPFHSEKTPSFRVNEAEGFYKCFGCGAGGDVIKFEMDINNIDFKTAVKKLGGVDIGTNYTPPVPVPKQEVPKKSKWKDIVPIPDGLTPPDKFYKYKITKYFPYKNINGELIGYTCLYFDEKKKKNIVPLKYRTDGDKKEWKFKLFDCGNPIYGIEDLHDNPDAKILMVEGEKCRDSANEIFKKYKEIVVLSWLGGTQKAPSVDWSPLKGRTVIYWPDADTQRYGYGPENGEIMTYFDQPGNKAMIQINKLINGKSKIIKHPEDKINGWDIADAIESGWDVKKIKKYILDHMIDFDDLYKKDSETSELGEPFQCLGYNSSVGTPYYYYLPNGTNKVVELNPSGHSKMNLLGLAPSVYWERRYPGKTPNYSLAADVCMRRCECKGIYDSFRVRGRGAWFDDGRVVLHMGDRLIVDNKTMGVSEIDSYYIYESGLPIDSSDYSKPMEKTESKKLLDICKMFSWVDEFDAILLSGWLSLAGIGGAIDWRPHVWITGESGTGKSWIYDNVITPILGRFSLNISSSSTEPGIRGAIGNDAMPVCKDESEAETKDALQIHTKVLELVRQSSSNKGSLIVKGRSGGGGSMSYCIRSPFLFMSINAKLIQQSDESRFSILKLIKRSDYAEGSKFVELKKLVIDTITPEWCAGLRARSASMIPIIRKNVEVFATESAKVLMNNRYGEQIGTLLSGSYSLISDDIVSKEECKRIIDKINLNTIIAVESLTDQERLLFTICEQIVPHENEQLTVGALITGAAKKLDKSNETEYSIAQKFKCLKTLRKYGITIIVSEDEGVEVAFAKKHSMIERLLKDTPWDKGHSLVLGRYKGASTKRASLNGIKYWVVSIPYNNIFTGEMAEKYNGEF